jgi:cytochrome P450
LALCPRVLKPLIPWFSEDSKVVLQNFRDASKIIQPIIEKRRKLKDEALKKGKAVPSFNDAIEWGQMESAGVSYDPTVLQLILSFAAIHTTSDLLTQALSRLANDPQSVALLREEIIRVPRADGLTKNALANLKLMDSALKETLRVKPTDMRKSAFTVPSRSYLTMKFSSHA